MARVVIDSAVAVYDCPPYSPTVWSNSSLALGARSRTRVRETQRFPGQAPCSLFPVPSALSPCTCPPSHHHTDTTFDADGVEGSPWGVQVDRPQHPQGTYTKARTAFLRDQAQGGSWLTLQLLRRQLLRLWTSRHSSLPLASLLPRRTVDPRRGRWFLLCSAVLRRLWCWPQ